MANKGVLALAAATVGLGTFLLLRKKKVAAAPVPAGSVGVTLLNPPSEAELWQIIVYDWNEVSSVSNMGLGIEDQAVLTIPPQWVFPLRADILIYTPPGTIYYRMHSTETAFPEFYREAFIADYGSYYYNVSDERFE